MRHLAKVSVAYPVMFRVVDASGTAVTGLVNGDFVKYLYKDAATDATTVTVTEIDNGQYKAVYTPASAGYWYLVITNATYNTAGWEDEIQVVTFAVTDLNPSVLLCMPLADVEAAMTTYRCLAGAIATDVNKKSISGSTLTIKKTDDTTTLFTAALTTDSSQAPITGVDPA